MGALEDVISEIAQDIKPIEEGEYGEAIFDKFLFDVPELDDLLEPEPDVVDKEGIPRVSDNPSVLGVYIPMSSPGQVILYSQKIKRFFWSLVRRIHHRIPYITKFDLTAGSRFVAMKTYHHEIFHFNCDVFRMLLGSSYDVMIEEALAVAYARMKIAEERKNWQAQTGRMNGVVYGLMMDEAFRYRAEGYKDWVNYADEARFKQGLLDYIGPHNYQRLQSNNVSVEELVYGMLGKATGSMEKVI